MLQTFANFPSEISNAISAILAQSENTEWTRSAEKLHSRYMERENDRGHKFIQHPSDVLAYLGLRVSATYAQIYSTLLQVQEMFPSWQPTSLLDLGSGPGTGVWAAKTVWPDITTATCIDQEKYFTFLGKEIIQKTSFSIDIWWQNQELLKILGKKSSTKYDVVIIANVLNELAESEREQFLTQAYARCQGVMIVIEPGTPLGFDIVQTTAKQFSGKSILVAPYIDNSYIQSEDYWIHFPQRFIRPEFLRVIRQKMRNSSLMASDWEEAKYSYVAVGKIPPEEKIWGRCIGPITKQKGFLEIPILTSTEIMQAKVMKRHKKEYTFAKNLRWGEIIRNSRDILHTA